MTAPRATTILVRDDDARLTLEAAELRVVAGPDRGRAAELSIDGVLIGSSPDCDLVLTDDTVSGRHAEVRMEGGGFVLRDLGSRNGLAIGPWPVQRVTLAEGMRLRLGQTELEVARAGPPRLVDLAPAGASPLLVAHSLKMRALVRRLESVAPSDAPVLLEGEAGVGKEVVAEAIHALGPRGEGPLVVCDCAALSSSLAPSDLFGHEAGAFTGATAARPGLLEEADGGTLLLDEIDLLPLDLQPLLLAALGQGAVRRVGGADWIPFDARIIATSRRRLATLAAAGHFRADLYHRLAVVVVRVPPLRERWEDIPVLAHRFAAELGAPISPELVALLQTHEWPGNARELRHAIARIAVDTAALGDLAAGARVDPLRDGDLLRPLPEARRLAAERFERRYLERLLAHTAGNVSRAATLAGVSRQALTTLVARHHLRARDR